MGRRDAKKKIKSTSSYIDVNRIVSRYINMKIYRYTLKLFTCLVLFTYSELFRLSFGLLKDFSLT